MSETLYVPTVTSLTSPRYLNYWKIHLAFSPPRRTSLMNSGNRYTCEFFLPQRHISQSANLLIQSPDPKDAVVLMRTPHLSPYYAAFDVPRHFSKLDLQAYLKNVYNVDVLHIRSVVVQQKVDRKQPVSQYTQGPLYRPASIKKMTVQLAKPFVYPEEITDLDA